MKSLQGSDIETYANQLFRFWKLGEAKKNNGVLLLVAPASTKFVSRWGTGSKARSLTHCRRSSSQARSSHGFKTGDFSGGIERGVDGIISVLSGDSAEWQQKVNVRTDESSTDFDKLFPLLFFAVLFLVMWYLIRHAGGGPGAGGRRGGVGPIILGSGWGGGFGGGGFSGGGGFGGGGFSGGGGSSGGGGASGGW